MTVSAIATSPHVMQCVEPSQSAASVDADASQSWAGSYQGRPLR